MAILRFFPTFALEKINDLGAYYYACYLSINLASYVPVALACATAIRNKRVRTWTNHLIERRLALARTKVAKKPLDPVRKFFYKKREKRWAKMQIYARDETKSFALGFTLGLIANETILMPPELVLAYPLTDHFQKLIQLWPWMDEKLYNISKWGLESIEKELDRRKNKKQSFKS